MMIKADQKGVRRFRDLAVDHHKKDPIGTLYNKEPKTARASFLRRTYEPEQIPSPIYQLNKHRMFLHTSQGIVYANISLGSNLITTIKGEGDFIYSFHRLLEEIS